MLIKNVLVIDDVGDVSEFVEDVFKDNPLINVSHTQSHFDDMDSVKWDYNIILFNMDGIKSDLSDLNDFFNEYFYSFIIPIIVLSSDKEVLNNQNNLNFPILFYLSKPINKEKFSTNILNILSTFEINLNFNDVSGLPGCELIDKKLLDEMNNKSHFALIYLDLDNFKEYNEYYGFKKADEILIFFSNMLLDIFYSVKNHDDFLGHIGGDDFVMILNDYWNSEKVCEEIIHTFKEGIKDFYDEEDLKNGYIETIDRKGNLNKFPIMGISICVIKFDEFSDKNLDNVYKEVMRLKKEAKKIKGCSYLIKE